MKSTEPIFNQMNYFANEGEKGMTCTSANKLANLAKERNREDMLFVSNVRFYDDVMTLLDNPTEKVVLNQGLKGDEATFVKIREALLRTARFNAFISWVREAISAKEELINNVRSTSVSKWCKHHGIEYPQSPDDEVETLLYEGRAAGKATIDEMARYFINQAKASVLGQAVHPDGSIDKARRDLIEAMMSPSRTEGYGKDTVIKTKNITADSQTVTDFYMSLQNEWRHAESSVNEAKGNWELDDTELLLGLKNEYNAKVRAYDAEITRIKQEWEHWKLEEVRRIGKLKIRIPLVLQPVLDELLSLGKE